MGRLTVSGWRTARLLCALLILAHFALVPGALARNQFWEGCRESCMAEGHERLMCGTYCICVADAVDRQLTMEEKLELFLHPFGRKADVLTEPLRRKCGVETDRRTAIEKDSASQDSKVAASFCKKDETISAPAPVGVRGRAGVRLGVTFRDVHPDLAAKFGFAESTGAYVADVGRGPSWGKLIQGNIILKVNNRTITDRQTLVDVIDGMGVGSAVVLCGIKQSSVVGKSAEEFVVQLTLD